MSSANGFLMRPSLFVLFPATAGSVLCASTSLVFGNFFAGLEDGMWLLSWIHHRQLQIDFLDVFARPTDAADLNLAVAIHKVSRRNVGHLIGIRDDVVPRIIDGDGEGHSVLLHEGFCVAEIVLRYADDGDGFGLVNLRQTLKIGKSVLASGTAHLEKSDHDWSTLDQLGEDHRLAGRSLQSKFLSLRTTSKRH